MEETNRKYQWFPVIMIHFVQELLSNNRSKGLIQPCLQTFRRFVCHFNSFLQQTEGEFWVLLTSNPKSEIFMNNS